MELFVIGERAWGSNFQVTKYPKNEVAVDEMLGTNCWERNARGCLFQIITWGENIQGTDCPEMNFLKTKCWGTLLRIITWGRNVCRRNIEGTECPGMDFLWMK